MKAPRLKGHALIAARTAAENPATAAVVRELLKKNLGLDRLGALPAGARAALGLDVTPQGSGRGPRELPHDDLPQATRKTWPRSHQEIAAAFAGKRVEPKELAERSLRAVTQLAANRVLNVLVCDDPARTRREAAASARRHAEGRALGPLDGIPVLIKDELDVEGLPTRAGSLCEPDAPKHADSTVMARLAQAGAVFVGKTVMTEWGMSPLGQNPGFKMPTNAYHAERAPGGSSTGSALGVALGAVPLAVGTDGGGSVRIPAALNGIFGLKPTFGRVSRAGGPTGSVGHVGPLGAAPSDLAAFLDAVASTADPLDHHTLAAPPPPSGGFGSRLGAGVRGLRIGVLAAAWAESSSPVADACRSALHALERAGAVLVDVEIPLAAVAAPIGYLTIGCESVAAHAHHHRERRERMGDDLRLSYAVLAGITAVEFLDAQQLRAALRLEAARVLAQVDVLAMPTTATTAPLLPVEDRGRAFADTEAIDAMCRFNFLGNLTGLPAGTAPVGSDEDGLPIGLQLIGDAWAEHVVLGVLAHLERLQIAVVTKPKAALDILA